MDQVHSLKIREPRLQPSYSDVLFNSSQFGPFYISDCIHEPGSENNALGTFLPKEYLMKANSTTKNSAIVVSCH